MEKNTLNKDSFETKQAMETWRRSWNLVMKFESANPATNSQNKILQTRDLVHDLILANFSIQIEQKFSNASYLYQ